MKITPPREKIVIKQYKRNKDLLLLLQGQYSHLIGSHSFYYQRQSYILPTSSVISTNTTPIYAATRTFNLIKDVPPKKLN